MQSFLFCIVDFVYKELYNIFSHFQQRGREMKKLLSILLISLFIAVSFFGCSGADEGEQTETTQVTIAQQEETTKDAHELPEIPLP